MDPQSTSTDRAVAPPRCTPLRRVVRSRRPVVLPTLSAELARSLLDVTDGQVRLDPADDDLLDRFLEIVGRKDTGMVHAVVDRLLGSGVSGDRILLGLLAPAAQRLGELWEDDARSFVDVTLDVGRLQELLRWIVSRVPPPLVSEPSPQILLVTPSGEDHTFGASLFHAVLRFRGWSVVPVPPFWTRIEASLGSPRVSVFGISVGTERNLGSVRSLIRRARSRAANPSLVVLVGGALVATDPDAAEGLGADGAAADAETALDLLGELVPKGNRPEFQA